jgi:hypothetical protein
MAQVFVYGRYRSGGRNNGSLKIFEFGSATCDSDEGPDRNFSFVMRYANENEIAEVVRGFEDATISRDAWKHAEHLTMALHYLSQHDIETATAKMREGIFKLLGTFGVDLTKEMPYHETLTVFWMRTVAEFNSSKNGASLLDKTNELVRRFDKDYPLRFYSREYLFSNAARGEFVEGDLA